MIHGDAPCTQLPGELKHPHTCTIFMHPIAMSFTMHTRLSHTLLSVLLLRRMRTH